MKWSRICPLAVNGGDNREIWERRSDFGSDSFPMIMTYGKKTDLLKLKSSVVSSLPTTIAHHQQTRRRLYSAEQMDDVDKCPVCGSSSEQATDQIAIHGACYVQCLQCSHVFVRKRPTKTAISQFYLSDVNYAATYTDRSVAESRLQTIAIPWFQWMKTTFHSIRGCDPLSVVDVGCGAGHFVEACRRNGVDAKGNEVSDISRRFAKQTWNLDLDGRDFCVSAPSLGKADVVTFWGLLEHTPEPSMFLHAAKHVIKDKGMVIAKLPRWDSLSTAAQCASPDTVIRHLDPMGHIMCFTDASAAELFYLSGLKPVAGWYYGMDVYELLMQSGNVSGSFDSFSKTGQLQMIVQSHCDALRAADGLVIAAVPMEN